MYNSTNFLLDNFEGPLELLLSLIQKEEIDPCGISMQQLTTQLMQSLEISAEIDSNSELLALTATLLLIKSQKLLPQEVNQDELIEESPRLEMINALIEYCRFKDIAKTLTEKEEEQRAFFPRAFYSFPKTLGPGLEEIDREGLKKLFEDVLKKADRSPHHLIKAEEWSVSDKIAWLRQVLSSTQQMAFESVFSESMGRQELIASFLALLEMMKHQELKIIRDHQNVYIYTNL